ncbi:MAG: hypothetical protein PSV17_00420 [Methylotenera sp.]|uniref:hypothetical protein n=1 Tax=Methylotenera sp. TaxID=2051956 RepID=UPI002487B703|nr:hypothetical protein [Methylotenera sp.]MDI1307880.1 hypothetical protein [Methylotenera sp.]
MKDIFDSYLYKISNLLGRNQPLPVGKHDVETETDDDLVHMSYNDYIKFINEEERKKASPLQPDIN